MTYSGDSSNSGPSKAIRSKDSQESIARIDHITKRFARIASKEMKTNPQLRKMNTSKWVIRAYATSCIILFALIIAYIPLTVVFIVEYFRGIQRFPGRGMIFFLPYMISFVNPLIYLWRIHKFRQVISSKCKRS